MPLFKTISIDEQTKVFVWKITESFDQLFSEVALNNVSLARMENMKSESHRKGFLGVRMLLQHIGHTDFDLYYDVFGKPHLKGEKHISISHSYEFSALAISKKKIGIDLEKLKEKTLKIAPRYMDISHLKNLSVEDKIKKATVVWGIKETLFKIKNEFGISFLDHIFESPFSLEDKKAKAQLKFNNQVENFKIVFDSIEDYIFVCAFENN